MTLLQMRVPAEPWHVRQVRDQLLQLGEDVEMCLEVLEDFVTAIGEAFANAIEHSLTTEPVEIEVRQRDTATGRDDPRSWLRHRYNAHLCSLPPATTERGRGIPLMRKCSSSMSIQKPRGRRHARRPQLVRSPLHGLDNGKLTQTSIEARIASSVSSTSLAVCSVHKNITSFCEGGKRMPRARIS